MKNSPISGLVSVIVTSYNHSQYLTRRMDSLLNQSYLNIEIIAIDDCSTENNAEILRRYESHPKVRLVLQEKNLGLVRSMNQGIELSSGQYVIVAQCDDDCAPQMIQRLVAALQTHPSAGMSFCRSQLIDGRDQSLGEDVVNMERTFQRRCAGDTLFSGDEMSRFLLYACVIPNMSALLMRRDCLDEIGGITEEFAVCVDWDLFFRAAKKYDFAYVAKPLNRFRQHANSIRSLTKSRITYEEYLRLLLGQIQTMDLTLLERARFRTRVMYLWAVHLLPPTRMGLGNFPFHLGVVIRYDAPAIVFLWLGLAIRASQLLAKLIFGKNLTRKIIGA